MSAPSTIFRQASSVRYDVLSVKASKALQSALNRRRLSDEQRETLKRAATFLEEISDGAKLATGTFAARARPSRSIAALDFAIGPIDLLQSEIDGEIAPYFDEMAQAVTATAQARLENNLRPAARHALAFFRTLHLSLIRDRQARRIVLGGPRRKLA